MAEILQHNEAGHETTDVHIRPILLAGVALALTAAMVLGLSVGVFRYFTAEPRPAESNPMANMTNQIPPAPRIEDHPSVELQDLRAYENRMLSTYGWVDRNSGKVRIPIDRALELQLQRGFPTRKEAPKP